MSNKILIQLLDGTKKEATKGMTIIEFVATISPSLAKKAIGANLNSKEVDVTITLEEDSTLEIFTYDSKQGKEIFHHSSAHLLGQAVQRLYPKALLTVGPVIESGPGFFYYDIDFGDEKVTQDDLKKIESEMEKIVKENLNVRREVLEKQDALKKFQEMGEKYKVELITGFESNTVTLYYQGEWFDLCRGPHIPNTGLIKFFKLTALSGAYWKADSNNKMLQRIYGVSFQTKKELDDYVFMIEESKKRDHRKLGAELELFTTSEKIGPGLILWLPRGNKIKEELEHWGKETEEEKGYSRVTTPVLTKESLFYTSEHLPHYKESMFPPMQMDNENYYIKPMNCPFHHTIFADRTRSYRELPLRIAEYGLCHRYEDSGTLFGLMRVRGMSMNDAHIYCAEDQAVEEFKEVIKLHEYYYKTLGIKDYYMVLSLRDPENKKYHGEEEMWAKAESLTRKAMEESGVRYVVENDGAAFYGPKMDFQIKSSIGREFTASTCQLDLFMPMKFDLKYIDRDGQTKRPVCIHRSPLGTHERFIGFLIEHFAGAFPVWLAPEQVRILPVSENYLEYAEKVFKEIKHEKIRVHLDEPNDTLGKRIRNAEQMKIPYILVVGEKEKQSDSVNVRNYYTKEQKVETTKEFVLRVQDEIKTKKLP
ncbi:MAG: threonine--tRNA ligase [Leptospiraceae bacterium]|nr:threonine--tRNA ligase [Leptospiraceae bacterium]